MINVFLIGVPADQFHVLQEMANPERDKELEMSLNLALAVFKDGVFGNPQAHYTLTDEVGLMHGTQPLKVWKSSDSDCKYLNLAMYIRAIPRRDAESLATTFNMNFLRKTGYAITAVEGFHYLVKVDVNSDDGIMQRVKDEEEGDHAVKPV